MKLGLFGLQRDRAFEQRQRGGGVAALVVNHAGEMLRQRIIRMLREHLAIDGQRGIGVASLVQQQRLLQALRGAWRGGRRDGSAAGRTVTMLVALATAAGTRIVAGSCRRDGGSGRCTLQARPCLRMVRRLLENAGEYCRGAAPLAEGEAVAAELQELGERAIAGVNRRVSSTSSSCESTRQKL